jgi:DNA-binding NtrC family response regulator
MRTVAVIVAGANGSTGLWRRRLEADKLTVVEAVQLEDAARAASFGQSEVVLVSSQDGSTAGVIEMARQLRARAAHLPILLLVSESSEECAVAALRAGVTDYLRDSCDPRELVNGVRRAAVALRSTGEGVQRHPVPFRQAGTIVGESPAIRQVREYIPRVAESDVTVLITGETGVGKELVAELVHSSGPRRSRPCVAINCAAIPESLLESELFGFEAGAFTGASTSRDGTLKSADGGSVFFDEIGDMGLHGQAKILRVIETREVYRLGGRARVPLNIRVIAATNQELDTLASEGRFRKDLYYRLNVARIHLPPLRERKEDLKPLLDHYIGQFNRRFNRDVEGFTPDALGHLMKHDWPGNIRELRNLVEAVFVNLNGRRITYVDLPEPFRRSLERSQTLPVGERDRLLSALFATNWNKSKAAHDLRWSRMTLYRKIAKYHVDETLTSRKK